MIIIKITKSIISQKLSIAQKCHLCKKINVRTIPICPANLVIFKESWIFGCPKWPFWTPAVPNRDMMWYEILRPSLFSEYCASFMSIWPLLSGEGGLHILSWGNNRFWKLSWVAQCAYENITGTPDLKNNHQAWKKRCLSASWGINWVPLETPRTSRRYGTEGFKGVLYWAALQASKFTRISNY